MEIFSKIEEDGHLTKRYRDKSSKITNSIPSVIHTNFTSEASLKDIKSSLVINKDTDLKKISETQNIIKEVKESIKISDSLFKDSRSNEKTIDSKKLDMKITVLENNNYYNTNTERESTINQHSRDSIRQDIIYSVNNPSFVNSNKNKKADISNDKISKEKINSKEKKNLKSQNIKNAKKEISKKPLNIIKVPCNFNFTASNFNNSRDSLKPRAKDLSPSNAMYNMNQSKNSNFKAVGGVTQYNPPKQISPINSKINNRKNFNVKSLSPTNTSNNSFKNSCINTDSNKININNVTNLNSSRSSLRKTFVKK